MLSDEIGIKRAAEQLGLSYYTLADWRKDVYKRQDGKLYLSAVLDCFNGEIVAFQMHDNMKKELCIDTVLSLIHI